MNVSRRLFLGSPFLSSAGLAQPHSPFTHVRAPRSYPRHLQGVCTNERDSVYWSFTDVLVKTDAKGTLLKQTPGPNHLGDICYDGGKIYVAVNLGLFNDADKRADSWVYVYSADDLSLLAKHKTPEAVYGAGGIAVHGNRFMVVGGLPKGFEENYVFEYTRDFKFIRRHVLRSGYTLLGIQTAAFSDGQWWFGCYGKPAILLKADERLSTVQRFEFDCSTGIVPIARRTFLVARGSCSKETGCGAELVVADADASKGLVVRG